MSKQLPIIILIILGVLFIILLVEINIFPPGIDIYGFEWYYSIQFYILIICLGILLTVLFLFSYIENLFKSYNQKEKSVTHTFFSNSITLWLGVVAIIGIIWSILYGSLYSTYKSISYSFLNNTTILNELGKELSRLDRQCMIWSFFLIYFSFVYLVVIIQPLLKILKS